VAHVPLKEMKRKFAVSGVNIATKLATTPKSVMVKVAETKATKDEQMVEGSDKIASGAILSNVARAVVQVAQGVPQEQVSQAASQALVQRAPQPVPHGEGEETQDALDVGGTEGKVEEAKGQERENEEQEIGQETQDDGTHLHCDVAPDGLYCNNSISPADKFIASLTHVSPQWTQHVTMQHDTNKNKVADCHESKDAACHEGLAVGVGHKVRIGCGHEALRPNNLQCQLQLRDVEKGTNEGGGQQSEETERKGTEQKAEKEEVTERHEAENTETTKKKNIQAENRISVPTKVAGPAGGMMLSELRRKFLSTSAPRVSVLTNTSETGPVAIGSTRSLHCTPLHVSACQTSLATIVAVATSTREGAAQEGVADDVSQGAVAHVSKGGTSQGTAAKGAPSATAAGAQIVDQPAGKQVAEKPEHKEQHEEKHLKGVVQGALGVASGAPLGVTTSSRLGVVSSAPPLGVTSSAPTSVPLVPACPEGAHGSLEPLAHRGEEVERVRHEGQENTVARDSVGEVIDGEKQRDTEKMKERKERKDKKEKTKKRIERETKGRDKGDGGKENRQEKGGGKGRGHGEGMVLRIPRDTGISDDECVFPS